MLTRTLLFCALNAAILSIAEEGGGATETLLDLDTVDSLDFDKIEEAPGFVTPPDGLYTLNLGKACIEKYKTKAREGSPSQDKQRFAHYYEIITVKELSDPKEQAPAIGSKFSERFMLNEKGISYWKSKAKAIVGELGPGLSVKNVLAELNTGTYTFDAKIQNKKSKGDDGKDYTNTNVRVVAKEIEPQLP